MLEIIQFVIVAMLLFAAVVLESFAIFGVNRFRFSLNRLHAAAIGDTLSMTCVILAAVVYTGFELLSLKYFMILTLMWMTSPVSGHLISLLVYKTDEKTDEEAKVWKN
ncbi:MAG: monovalent cation/H(+) antiporter subunit G [Clostridia bacterium]|nr:monovalent cation/H(+) antiporter subunit G [Clostridia bacterium]MBQ3231443.1 monovalent cation/H(+) antiporter subunit G [Clostridia bacterium]MBQ4158583.1 monovalent cation/H(+) antiporter subunit G [Clostridia bacterium]MBQ4619553.1 monovalent cation/H(+) antiporter subunit G [Clostridia bacterium]MBQ9856759.1 monovalent cation/H(+) antiporter subunit G [Clostridia bacterium]